jgi:hypothetical protein
MLSIHLHLGLLRGLFPSGFPTNNIYTLLFSPIRATCLAHFILLDLIILIIFGEVYKSCSYSLYNFLHPPVTPSHFGPHILLSTLFSNILGSCSDEEETNGDNNNNNNVVTFLERHVSEVVSMQQPIWKFLGNRFIKAHIRSNPQATEI